MPVTGLLYRVANFSTKCRCRSGISSRRSTRRGRRYFDHRQAVVKIFPKLALGDQRAEIPIGGGDDAHVNRSGDGRTDALDLIILQYAQKFSLRRQRQFANLIQENHALVGELKHANLVAGSAGKRAANVAEEFTFEQRFHDGRAVANCKWTDAARTKLAEGASHQLFPGSRGPAYQHILKMGRNSANLGEDIEHDGAAADDSLKLTRIEEFMINFKRPSAAVGLRQQALRCGCAASPR